MILSLDLSKFLGWEEKIDSLYTEMKKIYGGPGTVCGLLLRIGQCASAAASIGVMVSATEFYNRTAFWYDFASFMFPSLTSFCSFRCWISFG